MLAIDAVFGEGHAHLADGVLDGAAVFEIGKCELKEAGLLLGDAFAEARMEVAVRLAAQGGGAAFPPEVLMCRHSGVIVASCK
jgi:hypothetical protein